MTATIPSTSIAFQDDDTAWWTPADCTDDRPCAMLPDAPCVTQVRHDDRPCDTCGGTGRVHCPGPSAEPKTQMQRDAAGLVLGRDYCYGMHMGHDCPDCIDGRHTFTLDVIDQPNDILCLRVSIVPGIVLPIVDAATWFEQPHVAVITHRYGATLMGPDVDGEQVDGIDIAPPPDAKPGGWLVQLRVQQAVGVPAHRHPNVRGLA